MLVMLRGYKTGTNKMLCAKVVSVRSGRDLTGCALFLLSALAKRSHTTLHTVSKQNALHNADWRFTRRSTMRNSILRVPIGQFM